MTRRAATWTESEAMRSWEGLGSSTRNGLPGSIDQRDGVAFSAAWTIDCLCGGPGIVTRWGLKTVWHVRKWTVRSWERIGSYYEKDALAIMTELLFGSCNDRPLTWWTKHFHLAFQIWRLQKPNNLSDAPITLLLKRLLIMFGKCLDLLERCAWVPHWYKSHKVAIGPTRIDCEVCHQRRWPAYPIISDRQQT